MNEVQEQFLKTLESLKALAKTKKNTSSAVVGT